LVQQNELSNAISEFETAIEKAPQRQDFHEHAAEAYDKSGNKPMAEAHRKIISEMKRQQATSAPQ
jgi:Tfp pilus assembly protein PilF